MRDPRIFPACNGCQHVDWCRRRGCTVWNDESREDYERLRRRSKAINDEIDQLEKIFGELP